MSCSPMSGFCWTVLRRGGGWLMPVLLSLGLMAPAGAATYSVQSNGTVGASDGLVWDQCSLGLSGTDCTDDAASTFTFYDAQTEATNRNTASYKGYTDWRVPTLTELESLVITTNYPTIDNTAFPGTVDSIYWTSTPEGSDPVDAWIVGFKHGNSNAMAVTDTDYVRLVRSGQSLTLGASGAPVLSAVALSNTTATGTTLSATSTTAGTGYWLAVPKGSTAPTARQVVDGVTYGSVSTVLGGSAPVVANTAKAFSITGLTSGTVYDIYFVAVDASLNASALSGPYPSTGYVTQANGTVQQTPNGLVWDQCSLGRSGTGCTGTASTFTFSGAQTEATNRNTASYKGYTDWRVPTRTELESLVITANSPAIDTTTFPGTISNVYWTSTPSGSSFARIVYFLNGISIDSSTTEPGYVRLVRSGQSLTLGAPGAPVLSAVALSNTTATGTTLSATSTKAGTGYWLVVPSGSTPPTVQQVVDGVTYGSVSTVWGGSAPVVANTAKAFSITGLTQGTAYQAYFVAVDGAVLDTSANASALSGPLAFTPKPSQTLTFGAAPSTLAVGGTASTSATSASPNSGNAVVYSVPSTTSVCSVNTSSGLVTGLSVGTCTVAADQAGNANYSAATQATQNISIAPRKTYAAPNPTSTGTVTTTLAGNSNLACGFATVSYKSSATGASANPPNVTFPHGFLSFTTTSQCSAANGAVTFTLTYPTDIPANAQYWKFGPEPAPGNTSNHWYTIPFTKIDAKTLQFSITDGQKGDDDLTANGTVVDDGGLGVPGAGGAGGVEGVPTLGEWALLMLAGLMGLLGIGASRRLRQLQAA